MAIKEPRYLKKSNVSKANPSTVMGAGASADSINSGFDVFILRLAACRRLVNYLEMGHKDQCSLDQRRSKIEHFEQRCSQPEHCSAPSQKLSYT